MIFRLPGRWGHWQARALTRGEREIFSARPDRDHDGRGLAGRLKTVVRFFDDFCYTIGISAHSGLHRSLRGNPLRLASNNFNFY